MQQLNKGTNRVLVTGAAGLLGSVLIEQLLSAGKQVTAMWNSRQPNLHASPLYTSLQCDILDVVGLEKAMVGIHEVYHCAGKVTFAPKQEHALNKINVEGTANIVNACIDAGVQKLLYVSSVAALGRIRENEPVNESMHWTEETGNSKYGQSKYLGELEVWRGIAEGLNAVIVNPVIILGAGNWDEGSTKIFKSIYNEFPWYSEGTSGFVDVRDVAKAMILLMDSEINSGRFIVSAENRSYQSVFNSIADAFGKKRPSKKVTPFIAAIVSRWEAIKGFYTGRIPLVTKETARTALAKVEYDNSKLIKHFPAFKYISIEQSIRDTCFVLQQKLNIL